MEIVIIGGIAAGMSAAAKAKRTNPEATITVVEKENHISFGACGLPYYLGGEFTDPKEFFARTPEQVEKSGIQLMLEHEVISVDVDKKRIFIKNLHSLETLIKQYDRLMIATGAVPIIPDIDGISAKNVSTFNRLEDVERLRTQLNKTMTVGIIGGGFIGVEVADQLVGQVKSVHLFEEQSTIVGHAFDDEISRSLNAALEETGVNVHVQQRVTGLQIVADQVTAVVTNDMTVNVDFLIVAIGVKPNTQFLGDNLDMYPNGSLVVNHYGQTSQKDIYAAGDCVSVPHRLVGNLYLPLATVANKLGRLVGENLVVDEQERIPYVGSLGSIAIKVGAYEAASVGITEKMAQTKRIPYKTTCIETFNHSNYYTIQDKIKIKLIYDAEDHTLFGAQLFGKNETVLRSTGLAVAIHEGMSTKELGFVDFPYAPPFSSTWEAINVAANTAK